MLGLKLIHVNKRRPKGYTFSYHQSHDRLNDFTNASHLTVKSRNDVTLRKVFPWFDLAKVVPAAVVSNINMNG